MSIEKIKEILIKDCQLHEHRGCECNPASADDCWGELAKELSALIEQARKEERQKWINFFNAYENAGYVGISNHILYSEYETLLKGKVK